MGKKFLPRIPQDLCALLLAVIIWAASPGFAGDIPPFTPNVVDPGGLLMPGDSEAINAALEVVRTKADIWGAVYIVSALNGESIESLAEQAFRAWKLGAAGKDNGLLLVIAMNDRASRFEVGYGLEGELYMFSVQEHNYSNITRVCFSASAEAEQPKQFRDQTRQIKTI